MECIIRCQHSETHHSTRNGKFCYVEQSYYKKINQQNALESYLAVRIHLAALATVLASEVTQSYQYEQESAYKNIFLASVVKYMYLDHSELLHCAQPTCMHVQNSTSSYAYLLPLFLVIAWMLRCHVIIWEDQVIAFVF